MSWGKHFTRVNNPAPLVSNNSSSTAGAVPAKISSYLPEVYAGHPNRIQRYYQYDDMDRDSDIHSALDTIADFCTQSEEQTDNPFDLKYFDEDVTDTEIKLLKTALNKWIRLNDFRARLWDVFRETIKNGDQFFLRDPETGEWLWIDHFAVEMVKVDEERGKEPDEYIIRGLDYNKQAKFATVKADPLQYRTPLGTSNVGGSRPVGSGNTSTFSLAGSHTDARKQGVMGSTDQLFVVDAQHVVHLSLSSGVDINWPFGQSVLEPVFKVFKQKELLEDAIIIYRVQRAPERRIFYIDTGSMPPNRAKAHIEQIKNEIHQRRIPNRTGGGNCFEMNTKVPLLDGRTLTLTELAKEFNEGKQNWAYSCDPKTGKIVPGKITWAGITRKNAKVIKLTLDNGKIITCTPDHKFPIWGKGLVQAKDIAINEDSCISFSSRLHSISSKENNNEKQPQYIQVYDHSEKKWKFVHRIVANYFKEINKHNELIFEIKSNKFMQIYQDLNKKQEKTIFKLNLDKFSRDTLAQLLKKNNFNKWSDLLKSLNLSIRKPTRRLNFNRNLLNIIVDKIKLQTKPTISKTCDMLNNDTIFIETFKKLNENYKGNKTKNIFSDQTLKTVISNNNYKNFSHLVENIEQYNHRVVSIEWLEEPIDVGTITIDGNEEFHNYHNFAIEQGIITQNSVIDASYNPLAIMDDYFIAQGCIRLNQKVSLLDGREITIEEIINEYEQGKTNYTYSINLETHEMEPGKIVWAGRTKANAELIRVTLDNGEHVDVTPDHRFIRRDGGEVEAKDLKPDDSLMPLYRKFGKTGPKQKNNGYTRYVCNRTGKTKFVHTAVCPKPLGREYVVHHIDFNSLNNNPDNLIVMDSVEHTKLHKKNGTYSLSKQWNDPVGREKLLKGIKEYRRNMSQEEKEKRSKNCRINGAKTWINLDSAERAKKALIVNSKKACDARKIKYDIKLFDRLVELFENGYDSISKIVPVLKTDFTFQNHIKSINKEILRYTGDNTQVGEYINDRTLNEIVNVAGYKTWGDFKNRKNHKVVSVEYLTERADTGDLTVESKSGSHVFALSCGIYIHNSEGRGSKVETLPGGELVGEIGDLIHFSRKLARGLRIPPLYLFGDDASNMAFNDGKLGTALVQEFLFNKYCMRLQSRMAKTFDYEFKYYLRKTSIEIDENMFELRFCPPQNFAKYRQIELDAQQMSVYTQIADRKEFSARYKKERYLGMTPDEITKDEAMWMEENPDKIKKKTGSDVTDANPASLSSVGVRSGAMFPDTGLDVSEPDNFVPDGEPGAEENPTGVPTGPQAPPPEAPQPSPQ